MSPPYKNDYGVHYTRQLFWEMQRNLKEEDRLIDPPFYLSTPHAGSLSARDTWVECGDPTGYKWAMTYLGSWVHYEKLLDCSWFVVHLEDWKRELDIKRTSEAVDKVRLIATGDSSQSLAANKYLAERGWEKTRGRPSKAEIRGELLKATQKIEEHEQDMERIGLRVIK